MTLKPDGFVPPVLVFTSVILLAKTLHHYISFNQSDVIKLPNLNLDIFLANLTELIKSRLFQPRIHKYNANNETYFLSPSLFDSSAESVEVIMFLKLAQYV